MTPIQYFFLLVLIAIIFAIGYFENYADSYIAQPDHYVWATYDNGFYGTRAVPVYYVDQPMSKGIPVAGLWNPNSDHIEIKKGDENRWINPGCSLYQHEVLHAWGYDEVELQQFNCPRPYTDYERLQYDPNFIKHKDPMYEHKPFDSMYVGPPK